MAYSEVQEKAAELVGVDWAGLLNSGLIDAIADAERMCKRLGVQLRPDSLAAIIVAWKLANPGKRVAGD